MSKRATIFLIFVLGGFILLMQTMFIVPETRQVMVLRFGDPVRQYPNPGLKAKIPFLEQVKVFEKRVLQVDPPASEEIILEDKKRIVVDAFARYKITNMLEFYQTLTTETSAVQRLNNLINSTVRSALGKVTLDDVLSEQRDRLMEEIQTTINNEVQRFGIEIVDVRIARADLPQDVSQSIYARMRSEREREAAEFRAQGQELAQRIRATAEKERTVLIAEAEKQAQQLRGQGDEQAITIYANAFKKDPDFYAFYRSLEAYRKSLADPDTTLVLSPDSEFFQYFSKIKKVQ